MTVGRNTTEAFCRAALFQEVGRIELRDVPRPSLMPGEALVRVECCTVCGSDLHTFTGARVESTPSVLGHEIIGVVEENSDPPLTDLDGRPLQRGDRVTWSIAVGCGECDRCHRGLPQKCRHVFKYGHVRAEGADTLSGGLAEFVRLRARTAVVRLDDTIDPAIICPANCATATVAAAFRRAGSVESRRVLVFGAGMLGLTAAAFARANAASRVVVCDPDVRRLSIAMEFGADAIVPWDKNVDALRMELGIAPDDLFDVVMDFSGAPAAVEAAAELADIGAHVVFVGSVMPGPTVRVDPEQVVRRCLTIHGVHNYAPIDLKEAIAFLHRSQHEFPFESLIERVFSLDDVAQAFDWALRERAVRVAVTPADPASVWDRLSDS